MKQKSNHNFQIFLIVISLALQVFLAAGLIYITNKNAGIINSDAIDKFIYEEQLKSGNESDQKLLKLAYISREIDIQAQKLLNQQNDVMRYGAKLLVLLIFIQIIVFISLLKTKKKDNIRFHDDAQ